MSAAVAPPHQQELFWIETWVFPAPCFSPQCSLSSLSALESHGAELLIMNCSVQQSQFGK